jgi:MGT family glycosyltransferase
MTTYLAYTSPARGHMYPLVPTLLELVQRGHEVHVRTLASEVDTLNDIGLHAAPIAPAIEDLPLTDWQGATPFEGLLNVIDTFSARAEHEVPDLRSAIDDVDPDVLFVDTTTIGANTVAEVGDRPWVQWLPFFYGPMPFSPVQSMEAIGAIRRAVGAPLLEDHEGYWRRAPLLLYFTAEPFAPSEPPIPSNFRMVGPGNWDPPAVMPAWLTELDEPIVLVTLSSEYQLDDVLVTTALEALRDEDVRVVATTVAHAPSRFEAPPNAIIEQLIPHQHVIARAACVVCHGGMGITQKALSASVPVCVMPGGRDQTDVSERVVLAGGGTRILAEDLNPDRLRDAVREAMTMTAGAARIAEGFARAGGATAAADAVEALVGSAVTI